METEQSKKVTTVEAQSKVKDQNRPKILRTMGQLWMSRKLWMTLLACALLWLAYWREVRYLYTFTEPNQITAFVQITRDFMVAFTAAVTAYLGITGFVQWKHGTESIVTSAASSIIEKKETKSDVNVTQHIIEEGSPNAPAVRPFSSNATEEE